jgi:hypothetical protein
MQEQLVPDLRFHLHSLLVGGAVGNSSQFESLDADRSYHEEALVMPVCAISAGTRNPRA